MAKIKIQNVGPIKTGYTENDGFLDLKKISIFIGNQGSGKSTVAKIISSFIWTEKALIKGIYTIKQLNQYKKRIFKYQNIDTYFNKNSFVKYEGNYYTIVWENNKLTAQAKDADLYEIPKVVYVPAERNFLSFIEGKSKLLNSLPTNLFDFEEEYRKAAAAKTEMDLPINAAKFKYDKLNKIAHIKGADYELRLSKASSGFQSAVPLFVTLQHLSNSINDENYTISNEAKIKLQQEIGLIQNSGQPQDVKDALIKTISGKYKNSFSVHIVEEPEQNLFPTSQREIFYKLLEFANYNKKNQLIITTHSPFLLSYLTLAVKGDALLKKLPNAADLIAGKLPLLPIKSFVSIDDVSVYELKDGVIATLQPESGLPSDDNLLNLLLAETNDDFYYLLKIQDKLKNASNSN